MKKNFMIIGILVMVLVIMNSSMTVKADVIWEATEESENHEEKYNEVDFRLEHSSEFEEYGGELDDYEIKNEIQLWTYPGSEVLHCTIPQYMEEGEVPYYEYLYTDPDGLRWTYIGYYYGDKGWVCVDDPENASLTTGYGPGQKEPALAVAAVIAVVVSTAVLIAIIFGKKKGKK